MRLEKMWLSGVMKHLKPIIGTFAAALVSWSSTSPVNALDAATLPVSWESPCKEVRFVAVRGSGETNQSVRGLGVIPNAIITEALANLPSSLGPESVGLSAVDYPAVVQSAADYNASVTAGEVELAKQLRTRNQQCPNEQVFLIGHSQGAHVIHRLLLQDEFANSKWVRQATLVADPARPLDSKKGVGGTFNTLAFTAGQPPENTISKSARKKVKNICSSFDIICSTPLDATLAFALAGITTACDTHTNGYAGRPRSGCWSRPPLASPAVRDILATAGLSEQSFNKEFSVNRVANEGKRLAKLVKG
jgi:hypothetical protein